MPFLDYEISDALTFLMRKYGTGVLGDRMDNLEIRNEEVRITTKAGAKALIAEKALVARAGWGIRPSWGSRSLG